MKEMEALQEQLIRHENLRMKPYKCTSGKLTIGVGRNIEDNGITEEEARYLLQNDITRVIYELHHSIPHLVHPLDSIRQHVLIDMCFNLGLTRFLTFKKMLLALEVLNFEMAAVEMLDSEWARQVGDNKGQRAFELARMMRTGEA